MVLLRQTEYKINALKQDLEQIEFDEILDWGDD